MSQQRIYLDHAATTPVHPQVLEAMLPFFNESFGNPSSMYLRGRNALEAIERALLLRAGPAWWARGVLLERLVHPLVPSVLLRFSRLDPLQLNAQPNPPH